MWDGSTQFGFFFIALSVVMVGLILLFLKTPAQPLNQGGRIC
ncbi:hypothetical protein HBZS_108880 [Helicobacter bizzozeronii CCUG 35545]|nr:hypothetical protein HBZS_108880 [Helicobacter bizzozeronii CCUG 35545]